MTIDELQAQLVLHDDGVLKYGSHQKDSRAFCVLEFDSIVRGRPFSDDPITLPDLRPLNDGNRLWISDNARTAALLPVMVALWDWSTWSRVRRHQWVKIVVIAIVRELIAELPHLSPMIADACRTADTLENAVTAAAAAAAEARAVAEAAATWATAEAAREAAGAVARAWVAAAEAAGWAAATQVLEHACHILIHAADQTVDLS